MCKVFELEQVTNSYATQTNDPLEGHHLIDEPAYILQTFWCIQGNLKGKHPESGGARWEITCWYQAEDSDAWFQQVIYQLAPPDERVFSFYTILTYGINNKWCQ